MPSNALSQEVKDLLLKRVEEKYPDPLQTLSAEQVGKLFQIPKKTIEYYARTGQIPFEQIGKRKRFSPIALAYWKMERTNGSETV